MQISWCQAGTRRTHSSADEGIAVQLLNSSGFANGYRFYEERASKPLDDLAVVGLR